MFEDIENCIINDYIPSVDKNQITADMIDDLDVKCGETMNKTFGVE